MVLENNGGIVMILFDLIIKSYLSLIIIQRLMKLILSCKCHPINLIGPTQDF